MEQNIINTVIVLRNDQTTNWESSEYKLLPGEVGIGYLKKTVNGQEVTNVIAKLGTDGQTAWKDLPQIEGVFEKEFTLTYDFGRYKTSNGKVTTTDATGMTTSQWLLHALSETKNPSITPPAMSFSVSAEGSGREVGDYITGLKWTGSYTAGSYQYGPSNTGVSESNVTWAFSNNIDDQTATTKTGTFSLDADHKIQLTQEASKKYATITGTYNLDASGAKDPLNNLGDATTGKFTNQSKTETKDVNATAYRKAFWGVRAAGEALDIAALTSAQVRDLGNSTTKKDDVPTSIAVAKGSQQVIIALKKGLKNTLVAKDANANNSVVTFTKEAAKLKVAGLNNYDPTDYDVWYVDWNPDKNPTYTGIGSAKALNLTWS